MSALVVLSTVSNLSHARKLAKALLRGRLAACVNVIGPIESHYRWQGKVHADREYLLVAKTSRNSYARLEKFIRSNHSYQIPEIIAMPVTKGSRAYLQWLASETAHSRNK